MLCSSDSTCNRLLKKAPNFALSSSKPSTGPGRLTDSAVRTDVVLLIRRTVRPRGYASVSTRLRPRWMAFLSSLPKGMYF